MIPNGKNINTAGPITSSAQIGELVRMARKSQGLTQQELAGLCGVGTRFLSELERGKESCELGKSLHILKMLGIKLTAESLSHE